MFGDQTFYRLDTLSGAVWSCIIVFNRVWSCLIKFEGHQTFDQKFKLFLLFSSLIGVVLFVWTAVLSIMFDAGMRTTLGQRLVSIV